MSALPEAQRPKSDDPGFWAEWSGKDLDDAGNMMAVECEVDWPAIANDWQQVPRPDADSEADSTA